MRNSSSPLGSPPDTVVLVVAFNREGREEQLTMRVGMLARRVMVGELHADFVADALSPEISGGGGSRRSL